MTFLIYFIGTHDGQSHHGNIIVDTPPSRENIASLREAIARMVSVYSGAEIEDPAKQITICNVIPLPDRIIKQERAPHILTRDGHGH